MVSPLDDVDGSMDACADRDPLMQKSCQRTTTYRFGAEADLSDSSSRFKLILRMMVYYYVPATSEPPAITQQRSVPKSPFSPPNHARDPGPCANYSSIL